MNTYTVTIDGRKESYPEGTPYGEIISKYDKDRAYPTILVFANGRLRELHKRLKEDVELIPVDLSDDIGHKTYKRSMTLLLLKAIYKVAGREHIDKVVLHYSAGSGYYYSVRGDVVLDEDFVARVKACMMQIVERRIPIMKRSVSTAEARGLFAQYGMRDKEKLFRFRRVSKVNIYSLDGFEDYYYGFMVWHTGYLKYFDLFLYDEGLILQLPRQSEPTVVPPVDVSPQIFQVQKWSEQWGEKLGIDTVGDLNEEISRGNIGRLLLIAEALQEERLSKIADRIAARKDVKFILIAGPSSSGKTTFSHRLAIQLAIHGLKPHPISLDNFYVNRECSPLDENGEYDFESLGALDLDLLAKTQTELLSGKEVELPRYNFVSGKREYKGERLRLGSGDVLIMEGIHGLNRKLSEMLPDESIFKIYISALTQLNIDEHNRIPTTDSRLIRRMVRDNRTRGTSAIETIARWPSVRRGEDNHIFPFQEEADVMYNTALLYELAVLKLYAEPLLFQIPEDAKEYTEAKRLLKFLDYFVGIPSDGVPKNSILREFIGGSCFDV